MTPVILKERDMSVQPAPVPARDERRTEALKTALAQIEKQFGKGSIMKLGADTRLDVEGISSGSLALDIALGGKGVPRGRVTEVFGPEGSGKTTLCLTIIANAQRAGGICAFVDAEHALDMAYAKKLGVNTNDLLLSQPEFGEQALEIVETLVRSGALDVIVIDSVAALTPRAEIEGEMGDPSMGVQARLMSQALRKLTSAISKSKTSVIFTNQLRMKIGVMFGNPETTTGGNALKFYASVRMDVRRIEAIKDGTSIIGNRTRVKVWQGWWIYWIGPIAGMLLAVLPCSFLAKRIEVAKLYYFDSDRDRLFRRMAMSSAKSGRNSGTRDPGDTIAT